MVYIPSSLKATTSFTHIMQTKMPGTGAGPITVTSLRRVNDDEASPYDLVADSLFHALSDQLYAVELIDRLCVEAWRAGVGSAHRASHPGRLLSRPLAASP